MNIEEMIDQLVQQKIREHLKWDDCKSVYTGSIPVLASNHFNDLQNFSPP
ncbi:hypothetical protein [Falsiruegeria mediterranea]